MNVLVEHENQQEAYLDDQTIEHGGRQKGCMLSPDRRREGY